MASPSSDAVRSLNALVDSALSLVTQLRGALAEIQKNVDQPKPKRETGNEHGAAADKDGLQLAKDSSDLIKAHATKLSLLVISDPFTPSAITTVIRDLVSGPLTGLATAVELCEPKLYTHAFQQELLWRSQAVYSGLLDFLQKIPRDGKVLTDKAKEGSVLEGRGSLASTGILWSACDQVIELATHGLRGFYVHKAGEWKETLKDISEELKEWGDEEPEASDDEETGPTGSTSSFGVNEVTDKLDNTHLTAQNLLDDLMQSNGTIPRDDPDGIRPRLESTLRRLRLAVLLCMAVEKRRFKTLPATAPSETIVARLSLGVEKLHQLPEDFGDLAAALYELDPEEIDEAIECCCSTAVAIGETFNVDWTGEADEFTEWMTKFRSEIRKA